MRVFFVAAVLSFCATAPSLSADATILETEVTATVEAMAARWNAGQRHTITQDFWDASDPKVMYLAGEQADWLVGLPAIDAYLAVRPNAPPTISSFVVSDIRVRSVAPMWHWLSGLSTISFSAVRFRPCASVCAPALCCARPRPDGNFLSIPSLRSLR